MPQLDLSEQKRDVLASRSVSESAKFSSENSSQIVSKTKERLVSSEITSGGDTLPSRAKLPPKRRFLHNMSPNVPHKAIYLLPQDNVPRRMQEGPLQGILHDKLQISPDASQLTFPISSISSSATLLRIPKSHERVLPVPLPGKSNFERPKLPRKAIPTLGGRSKSSIPSRHKVSHSQDDLSFPPSKIRRTTSMITDSSTASGVSTSDRFIPSRHNSTLGKLSTNTSKPLPDASPETHIKAHTSKIYQHQVAEACGLEMNSRVLVYQPAPPASKAPINLFSHLSSNTKQGVLTGSGVAGIVGKYLSPTAAAARARKIPTGPDRVLDAPGLVDDFYLNIVSWSLTNLLALALKDAVYVWNASTGSVGFLCDSRDSIIVTSLRWSEDGSYISIGRNNGSIEIWGIETNTKLRTFHCQGNQTRVALMAWSRHVLTSGSRTGVIYNSDVRVADHFVGKLEGAHSAEVCGIEYRKDGQQVATGGNDNLVCIWDARQCTNRSDSARPLFTKTNHMAAVKALAWCPWQSNLLATGGGSNDKTINFWNTATGSRVKTIETGSQVSSLNWGFANETGMEVVATHGYPTNSISLYNYSTLQKTGEIQKAHNSRILDACLSPDRLSLATLAGDENLKFWPLFDVYKSRVRLSLADTSQDENSKNQTPGSNILSPHTKGIKSMHIR